MEYFLFTYPNCRNCDELKEYLKETALPFQEFELTRKESKMKIRDFLQDLNRDEKGAIIIPTLIVQEGEEAPAAVLNSRGELEDWLKSRA